MRFPPTRTFGVYPSSPQVYSFNGTPGWFTVPAGRNWFQVVDANRQIWVSPNPITVTNGVASGSPLYAASLNLDGTLVFQDALATREMGIDIPQRSSVHV